MKVLVLGAGKMLEAILVGLKESLDLSDFRIFSPSGLSAQALAKKIGAKPVSDLSSERDFDWILVGCKPQQLKNLKLLIGDQFQNALFVSVLAALSEKNQLEILGAKRLVRIMPNLPVKVRAGVVLMSSDSAKEKLDFFEELFSRLGKVSIVKEAELEELTLLTGSGPAFFYEFALQLSRLSRSLTLTEREELARKVLEGAGLMLHHDQEPLSSHISNVTSKGGVTIAVLEKWRELDLGAFLKHGFDRGMKRIEEIRESLLR